MDGTLYLKSNIHGLDILLKIHGIHVTHALLYLPVTTPPITPTTKEKTLPYSIFTFGIVYFDVHVKVFKLFKLM